MILVPLALAVAAMIVAAWIEDRETRAQSPSLESNVLVVHAGEQLEMARPLRCGHLMIHLSATEPTTIETRGHALSWCSLEILGSGAAEFRDNGEIATRWER